MDHLHQRSSVLSRALVWLLLITGLFAESSRRSDIECLRSIKDSLHDPQNKLSNWMFTNSICSFNGVDCWDATSPDPAVLNLRLSGMGLGGQFPLAVATCTALTGLDLSHNHLHGSIPSNISRLLPYSTNLDLSYNTFSGEIPPGIANCSYLNVLNLNNNLLTGPIPPLLASLRRLKSFTVAGNLLSGPVPEFIYASFPPEIYGNNTGLCDYPLDPCKSGILQSPYVGGFLAGWAVSFSLLLAVGMFTPFLEFSIKFVKRKLMAAPRFQSLPSSQRMDYTMISMLEKFATRMSFPELRRATNNFSEDNVIAIGAKGTVYKAVLSNGWCLAIKRLCNTPHIEREFLSEIMTLGRLRHRNLVPLLGFCHELNERFLVYKFMPKGSLYDCLFSSEGEAMTMEWSVKAKIAVGIAKGIAWLHLNRVVHRGISSKCILLDNDFNPRISDFGRAANLNHNNPCLEHTLNREPSDLYKKDVEDFGKVLLELITGTKYNDVVSSLDNDADLFDEARPQGASVWSVMGQEFHDEMSCFVKVAGKCLKSDPCNWPSMEEVYQMLIEE